MAALGYVVHDAWEKSNRWALTGLSLFFILQLRLIILHLGGAQLGTGGISEWLVMLVFALLFGVNFLPEKWWRRACLIGLAILIVSSIGVILFFNPEVYLQEGGYFSFI